MKHYGLIGYPLSHSFSKKFFADKFEQHHIKDTKYDLYPIEKISDLPKLLDEHPDLLGLNVTIPHKIGVMKYLDWIEHDARKAGAVNCIRITKESPVQVAFSGEVGVTNDNFRLEGFNTDLYGFQKSLEPLLSERHDQALVLGNGGAAKAVKCVLENKGISYLTVTRKKGDGDIQYDDLKPHHIKNHLLIVNTTPLGMSPNVDECPPIPYEHLTSDHLLYDLIYNPEETLFLKKGREKGTATKNGHEMLILQAEKSWHIWNSKELNP